MSDAASDYAGDSGFRSDNVQRGIERNRERGDAELREKLLDACRDGKQAEVRKLVGEGLVDLPSCVVNDGHGDGPLHVAALRGHKSIVEYLVDEANCDAEIRNAYNNTPLHRAAGRGHLVVVKYLVEEKKCDPMVKCDWKRTPLHKACKGGQTNVVKYLMGVPGVDASAKDSFLEQTPLQLAAEHGTHEVVQYMVEKGIKSSHERGTYTLLHLAAYGGKIDTVKYLVEGRGCDVMARGKDDLTPLHSACKSGQLKTVKYLMEGRKPDMLHRQFALSPLDVAATHGKMNVVKYLVEEKSVTIEHGSENRDTPLHHAAMGGQLEVLKYFIDERDCNPACKGKKGRTPLHSACKSGKREILDYLIGEKQVNASVQDRVGATPLHLAAKCDRLRLVKRLVYKYRCNHLASDSSGKSPLKYASQSGYTEIVTYFQRLDDIVSSNEGKFVREGLEKYTLHCQPTGVKLGRGAWSTVVELEQLTDGNQFVNRRVAGKVLKPLKSMEMKEDGLRRLIKEIEVAVGLRHDHVVACKGVCFLPDTLLPVLVMEQLMSSLHAYLKNTDAFGLTLDKKRSILSDVASGLDFLHNYTPAIVHRDVTPKNVLLSSEGLHAKISDCCDARILAVGTYYEEDSNTNCPPTDIKLFGLLALFTVLHKEVHPPKSQGRVSYRLGSVEEERLIKEVQQVLPRNRPLLELIQQCLGPAEKRPRASELKERLQAYPHVNPCKELLKQNKRKATPTGTTLGSGAYGKVIEMKLDREIVAGKIFKVSSTGHEDFNFVKVCGEVIRMMNLDHPNIIKCKGITFLPDQPLPVLLMEKLESNLHNYILKSKDTKILLEEKVSIMLDTARGLHYLHSCTPAIIHRDLTARNVLLDSQKRAKIADFGNSRIMEHFPDASPGTLTSFPGTLEYMPPEAQGGTVSYGTGLDVFSFGHLLLFTVIQRPVRPLLPPTYTDSSGRLHARPEVKRRQSFLEEAQKLLSESHPLLDLMKQCLHHLPERRPHTRELVTRLQEMTPHDATHQEAKEEPDTNTGSEAAPQPPKAGSADQVATSSNVGKQQGVTNPTAQQSSDDGSLSVPPKMKDLANKVAAVIPHKWKKVAVQLELERAEIETICKTESDPQQQFMAVFDRWENSDRLPYTWKSLITALKSASVDEHKLAKELQEKFC